MFVITEVLKALQLDSDLQVASDGESVLKLWDTIEAEPEAPCPGLILLDLNLPRISGLEVLRRVRNGRRGRDVPVVVVTSSDSVDDVEAVGALNVSAYFRKPADLQAYLDLGGVIRSVLSGCKTPSDTDK